MKREFKIYEIMLKSNVDYEVAEAMFQDEICEKYNTRDTELAESMFDTEW